MLKKLLIIGVASVTLAATGAYADCTFHIQNKSTKELNLYVGFLTGSSNANQHAITVAPKSNKTFTVTDNTYRRDCVTSNTSSHSFVAGDVGVWAQNRSDGYRIATFQNHRYISAYRPSGYVASDNGVVTPTNFSFAICDGSDPLVCKYAADSSKK